MTKSFVCDIIFSFCYLSPQVVLLEVYLKLINYLPFVPLNIELLLLAKIYFLLSKTLLICLRLTSQNITSLCPNICLLIEPIELFTEKISHLSQKVIKMDLLVISKLVETLPALILKGESRTEEQSK